jgi:hypothetical protein
MTGGALIAIGSLMRIDIAVAGCTVCGRTFEDTVDMTVCASHGRMLTIEMEGELRVIHFRGLPTFW